MANPIMIQSSSRRWIYPCGGRHHVIPSGSDATHSPTTIEVATAEPETIDLTLTFRMLSTAAKRLKRRVRDLKTLYVRHRFRDEATVVDLDQMGLTLEGMPDVHQPTIASINDADMTTVVHRAFEHLARVAVFVNQARIGEALAVNEPISFERDFERIEDHHHDGLYWLLCAVQTAVGRTSRPTIDPAVVDAIMRMHVVGVDRNAMRHTRDYLVLRDFERLLERLSIEFAALGRLTFSSSSSASSSSASATAGDSEAEIGDGSSGLGDRDDDRGLHSP